MSKKQEIQEESFEAKLEKSKALLDELMKSDITLEASVKLYEEGLSTIAQAQKLIENAQVKITLIEKENQYLHKG